MGVAWRICSAFAAIPLAGCLSTPRLGLEDPAAKPPVSGATAVAPTVQNLVDHVKCEMARAYTDGMSDPKKAPLFAQLKQDHVQVSVDLSLTVTNVEALNATVSKITPLTYKGHRLKIFPPAPPATPGDNVEQPSDSYNWTLALSGALSKTADHQFDLQYAIDMGELADEAPTLMERCFPAGTDGGIEGSLDLEEVIAGGLAGIDEASRSLPKAPSGAPGGGQPLEGPPVSPPLARSFVAAPAPATGGALTTTGQAQFSSKIDFTMVQGVSGGPSITLLAWSAGGGTNPLLNANNTKLNTALFTFSATCHDRPNVELVNQPPGRFGVSAGARIKGDPNDFAEIFINPFRLTKGEPSILVGLAGVATRAKQIFLVKADGFYDGRDSLHLTATLSDPLLEATAGTVDLEFTVNWANGAFTLSPGNGGVSTEALNALWDRPPPTSYWDGVQFCSQSSAKMGALVATVRASGQVQNLLLRLPGAFRTTP